MAPALSLRSRIAASAAALGLLFALGCGGKSNPPAENNTGNITGTVTYTRQPMTFDANGVPTGLDTDPAHLQTLPLRGVAVVIYQLNNSTGSPRWVRITKTVTGTEGKYVVQVQAGKNYLVQVEARLPSGSFPIQLIGDPNGLASTLPVVERPLYILREASDGTAATPTTPTPTGKVPLHSFTKADFTIDGTTTWMLGSTEIRVDGSAAALDSATFESAPSGSRPAAILDSIFQFAYIYGPPAPGAPLDLHYRMGRTEAAGTYIEYRPNQWISGGLDLAYNPNTFTDDIFGSIQGGPGNDDAYDPSVIYQLMGRSFMYFLNTSRSLYDTLPHAILPIGKPLDGLSPDQALVEGMPAVLAANILQSPYLADTDGTSALVSAPLDIRDLSGVASADIGPYSPRTLAAMIWEIALKANGVTSPGTPTDWAAMKPGAIVRIFNLKPPSTTTTGTSDTTTKLFDPANIYFQLSLLKNPKGATELVDLRAIFDDATINGITSPFNMPWPQPSSLSFGQAWTSTTVGTDGTTYAYNGTLSMAKDTVQVNGAYPNASYPELAYLGVSTAKDAPCQMSLSVPGGIPTGATIQVVVFSGETTQAYNFTASSSAPVAFTLAGSGSTASPAQYPVRVRLLSPSTVQADIPFTLTIAPAAPGTLRGPRISH